MTKIKATSERWAKTMGIAEEEYNGLLEELGYLVRVTGDPASKEGLVCVERENGQNIKWTLTGKGWKHARLSRNPFKCSKVLLWDFDSYFQAHKRLGKKRGTYIFCDKCDAYLNMQSGFNFALKKFVCEKCGHVNDTVYNAQSL